MRVAVIAPVWFPVPPTGYGGIELIVSLLADGLVDAGHDVTYMPSHVAARQFPATVAELQSYDAVVLSDIGANTLLLNMNVGALPHEMFIEQIRRFGRDVLPILQAHEVRTVPAALETA